MDNSLSSMVEAVKAHAEANYEAGGWDVIAECWSDENIADYIAESEFSPACTSNQEAIDRVSGIVEVYHERQQDAVNSAF